MQRCAKLLFLNTSIFVCYLYSGKKVQKSQTACGEVWIWELKFFAHFSSFYTATIVVSTDFDSPPPFVE